VFDGTPEAAEEFLNKDVPVEERDAAIDF